MASTYLDCVPPLSGLHLRVQPVRACCVCKDLCWPVYKMFSKRWVAPKTANGFHRITAAEEIHFVGLVAETEAPREPLARAIGDFIEHLVQGVESLRREAQAFHDLYISGQ